MSISFSFSLINSISTKLTLLSFSLFFFLYLNLQVTTSMTTLGGLRDSQANCNDLEIDSLARFAVDEHNKKQNAILEFGRVIKAKEQTVAGIMHHFTIEAIEEGKKKLYEAKVWVKPWLDFKELQEFNHVGDCPSITCSDLGARKGGPGAGWNEVAGHDPEIQNAANHALKTIQQRSNSLFPYELQEVVSAKTEVVDDTAKYDLHLKVKRGNKEEEFNVEVHKDNEGGYKLNGMNNIQPEH